MLRFLYDDARRGALWPRRELLRLGGYGLAGIVGASGVRALAAGESRPATQHPGFGRAKSVIVVYCCGGQSQIDLWDPKPEAPAEVRGKYRPIATSAPGLMVGELMPQIARLADRLTIVRSMSHSDLDHGSATYLALTGKYHRKISGNPPPSDSDEPTLGALLRAASPGKRFPYDAAHLNAPLLSPEEPSAGQFAGFLGGKYQPLEIGDAAAGAKPLPGLDARDDLPAVRLHERQSLKTALDRFGQEIAASPNARDMDNHYAQALALLDAPQSREAFDLGLEPDAVRDRYGRNQSGQALLLARRLVEAGLPLVTVFWSPSNRGQDKHPESTDAYGWDTHNDLFTSLEQHLMPRFDRGFSALIEDLQQRGLLDSTLVVCVGEFGRAPLIALEKKFAGSSPGRKHWANVYSAVFAGAGVAEGKVVGASDRLGGRPEGDRYGPWDTVATILSALGVDPSGHYSDPLGRPIPLCVGHPIAALYRG